jgi:hypothetical protein
LRLEIGKLKVGGEAAFSQWTWWPSAKTAFLRPAPTLSLKIKTIGESADAVHIFDQNNCKMQCWRSLTGQNTFALE